MVQGLMVDNSTEFINSKMTAFTKSKGISMFTSTPYTPQQNGVAERGIRTITEGARAMLYAAKLPKHLWSIAVCTMTYLRNCSPTRANNGETPWFCLTGKRPDLAHLHVFGCLVSVLVPVQRRQKWDAKSKRGYMVGYDAHEGRYLMWFPRSSRLAKARDLLFHGNQSPQRNPSCMVTRKPQWSRKTNQ
jgi:hypothetical protein